MNQYQRTAIERAIARERVRLVLFKRDGTVSIFNGCGKKVDELSGPVSTIDWASVRTHADTRTRVRREEAGVMRPVVTSLPITSSEYGAV